MILKAICTYVMQNIKIFIIIYQLVYIYIYIIHYISTGVRILIKRPKELRLPMVSKAVCCYRYS